VRSAPLLAALAALVPAIAAAAPSPGPARVAKWTEWHVTGDDVRLTLDQAGTARIEHAVRYRVVMGPLHQIDLTGIEPNARLTPEATVVSEDGRELGAHVEPKGDGGALRVLVDEPKGLKRGAYTFKIRYDADLVAAKELARDGAMWRLAWRSPALTEGYDAAHVFVDVPAAATEPRAIKTGPLPSGQLPLDGEEGGEDGVIASLRRSGGRDELELLRPHVARGESPLWSVRLDPKAFPEVHAPELRAPAPAPAAPPNRLGLAATAVGLFGIALALGIAIRAKLRAFAEACARADAEPRALVPLSPALSGVIGGVVGAAGVALELEGWPTAGAALLAVTMLFGVSRVPSPREAPHGPGRWLALRPAEAFPRAPRAGRLLCVLGCLVLGGMIYSCRYLAPQAPWLAALDALALLPLVVTGRRAQLPPRAVDGAASLARVFRAVKAMNTLRVVPWGRIPVGGDTPDALRLFLLPRASLPGLGAIELGVAWRRSASAWSPRFQALVRVHEDSDALARLARIAPLARPFTGKKPEERVVVLTPRMPGVRAAVALVVRVSAELTDRRVTIGGYRGPERRAERDKTDRIPAAA
jgi:hypothetical protein